jgi:alanine racemase
MGLVWNQLEELLDTLQIHKIYPEGIFTHLSSADEAQNDFTELQLERFLKVVTALKAIGRQPRWVHVANSAGALKAKHPEINMVRLGLGLYGLNPYEEEDHFFKKLDSLKPVLEFKSTLVGIQKIKKGERSGYGTHYKAPKDQTIGIIAAGYYEGIPIKLSNTGLAEVHGKRCPFIGRVCMNHTMILLEDVEAKIGDPVLVYSRDKSSPLCVFEQSKRAQAFHYEMITRLSQSVRRQAVQ